MGVSSYTCDFQETDYTSQQYFDDIETTDFFLYSDPYQIMNSDSSFLGIVEWHDFNSLDPQPVSETGVDLSQTTPGYASNQLSLFQQQSFSLLLSPTNHS